MDATATIDLHEADQDISRIVERIARTGQGVVVTKRGTPIVRILPVEKAEGALTAGQQAALNRLLRGKLP